MEIVIEAGVKEYLEKADTDSVVISMIPDRTNTCCGTGKTKKFYTPDIRPAKPGERFGRGFRKFQSNGVVVWVSEKALEGSDGRTLTIGIKKAFLKEELEFSGIDILF